MNRIAFLLLAGFLLASVAARASILAFSAPFTDSLPPTIICPPNDTVNLPPATCTAIYNFDISAYDDQPGTPAILQTSGLPATEPYPIGLIYNVFRATDSAGNTSTCSFTVLVRNYSVPLACEDLVTVALNQNCTDQHAAAYYLFGDQSDYGCPTGFTVELDKTAPFGNGPWMPVSYGAADIGKTYQFRVNDTYTGNKCWGSVKIIDNLAPTITCTTVDLPCTVPDLTPDYITNTLGIAAGKPVAVDNCGGAVTLNFLDSNYSLGCDTNLQSVIVRHWTAKDERYNTATCNQEIRIHRYALDDVNLPPDVVLPCTAVNFEPEVTGFPTLDLLGTQVPLNTACSMSAFYEDSILTVACSGHRQVLREWTIINWCEGDGILHVQTIDLSDSTGPVIQCPAGAVLQIANGGCNGPIDLPDAVLSDDCSRPAAIWAIWTGADGQPDTLAGVLGDFAGNNPADSDTLGILGIVDGFPVGINTISYYVTDDCGQESSCSFSLTVLDQTAPTAVCAPLQTVWLGADGTAELAATLLDGGSTADSCNTLSFRVRPGDNSFCKPDSVFSETLRLCCTQAGDTVSATLRVYDFAVSEATVAEDYAAGHFSDCTVQIAVIDTLPPNCTAPADTLVDCSNYSADLSVYGAPVGNCRVDSIIQSVDFQQFDIFCNSGTIVRTFTTYANGQAGGQCSQTIHSNYHQEYYIRFPDDVIVTACNGTNIYGSPITYNLGCEQMSITYEDEVFTIVPDACYKIERTWLVVNSCTYDSLQPLVNVPNPTPNPQANNPENFPGPTVSPSGTSGIWAPTVKKISYVDAQATNYSTFWSPDANGYRYKQIIKVIDTQPPVIACQDSQFWNDTTQNDNELWNESYWLNPFSNGIDLCEGEAPLSISATDACAGASVNLEYQLFLDLDGDDIKETVVQSTTLPGANKVYYYNAGNPNYSGGTARAFDERNVPQNQKYRFAIDRVRDGDNLRAYVRWDTEALPANSNNAAVDGVAPQLPFGTHKIKWFAYDACGNTAVCEYEFTINGTTSGCVPPDITIGGKIETMLSAGVGQVAVALNSPFTPAVEQNATSNGQGFYYFPDALPLGTSFSVVPYRNDNHNNGISTFDIVLLSKHILGIESLNSPYKIIAADINHSNSVTTFDVVELRKLVLGIYNTFPMNTSWRFVPKEYNFINPENPFFPNFQDSIAVYDLSSNSLLSYDFVGIKIGDLNLSAAPNVAAPADDRSGELLWFDLKDQSIAAGEKVNVILQPDRLPEGYQFTLEHPGLTLLDIIPENGALSDDNFAVFDGAFTTSWNGDQMPRFQAVFQANSAGHLRDMLRISDRITSAEAYWENDSNLKTGRVGLRFDTEEGATVRLFGNLPNPFSDQTTLAFFLPEPTAASLRVFDQNGRLVWQESSVLTAGHHERLFRREDLGPAGIYTCELTTASCHLIQKMILLDR